MNKEISKNAKNNFEKNLFKLMNNAVFGKTMENVRKQRSIKLVATEEINLASESNFHITKFFIENLLAIDMTEIQIIMNNPVYLVLSI